VSGEVRRGRYEDASARRKPMGDEAAIANRTVADHRVEAARGDVDEPIVELERHRDPGVLLHEADQRRREV
jgi:hypothetical protein